MRYKNLYLKPIKRNIHGEVLTYQGFHKKGFKFEIDFYREVWEPMFEVYNTLDNERVILNDSTSSVNFKRALKDLNHFFNNRTIKWKNF